MTWPPRGSFIRWVQASIDRSRRLQLQRASHGATLPFELKPELLETTLLFSREPLVYGSGEALGLANGAPAHNRRHQHFFVGRSDNFDAEQPSTDRSDARFDPESTSSSSTSGMARASGTTRPRPSSVCSRSI